MTAMRKKLAVVLSLFMVSAVVMAGCSESSSKTEGTSDPGSGNAGKSGAKVQLTAIMVKHPLTKPLAEMEWLKKAEEESGVEIKWQEITADWGQKKGTMLASGDVPDLFVGPNVITDADFAQFQGLFQDLSDLVNKDAPNVQMMFNAKPETKVIATQPDGKIYGLPKYQRFWPASATRQFINKNGWTIWD
jgi:putative aldouronate transport system substrate-binding protein